MTERMLSGYPEPKIKLGCRSCAKTAQYDVQAMLAAGGDRRLLDLLDEFKTRANCSLHPPEFKHSPRCRLHYLNGMPSEGGAYAKAKGR